MKTKIKTYAKLNLSLLVFKPRKDGYHPICSVFQNISLYDVLHIRKTEKKNILKLSSNNEQLPLNDKNILFRVFNLLKDKLSFGLDIHIEKNIPMGSGMGGGSANAAGLLLYINKEANLNYSIEKLAKIGGKIGADIPFFLYGGTALVRGIGDKIKILGRPKIKYFVIVNPNIHISTKQIYEKLDNNKNLLAPIKTPKNVLKNHLGTNTLLLVALSLSKELRCVYGEIGKLGYSVFMTGSGSTLFIPFKTKKEAILCENKLKNFFPKYFIENLRAVHAGCKL
jgi:4-diphosphocytidyl-2-C-methyl-D-erythritol kinase